MSNSADWNMSNFVSTWEVVFVIGHINESQSRIKEVLIVVITFVDSSVLSSDGIGNVGESDCLSVDSKIIQHFTHITP